MDCPYLHCNAPEVPPEAVACPKCRGFLKRCDCSAPNRSFARFCRACGRLVDRDDGWNGFRGGMRCLGLVPNPVPSAKTPCRSILRFLLDGACRGLLMRDGWLVAVSRNGEVAAASLFDPEAPLKRLELGKRVIAYPAMDRQLLYVGAENTLHAFSLPGLAVAGEGLCPHWDLPLDGCPVQALTPAFGHLYFHLMRRDRRKELHLLPETAAPSPGAGVLLDGSGTASAVCVEPTTRTAFFFSHDNDGWRLNPLRHPVDGGFTALPGFVPGGLGPGESDSPPGDPSVVGMRLYAVMGKEDRSLVRVNLESRFVDQRIPDVSTYVIATPNELAVVRHGGIHLTHLGVTAEWQPGDLPVLSCPPVLWRGSLLAMGLESGDVVLSRWDNPHQQTGVSPFGGENRQAVATLAGWREFLAVGNQAGQVEVFALG